MTEQEKMNAGLWYDANYDKELVEERTRTMDLCFKLNAIRQGDLEQRTKIIEQILGYQPESLNIISPFVCDYGRNIHFGKNVFVNLNSYFMDGASITVGDNVFLGPNCGLYTANHPMQYAQRNAGLEKALPIRIGNNVWLGANVILLPGVTIADGCVIAAGSVVTADIPQNQLAAGVPCKPVRTISQKASVNGIK